MFLGKRVKSNFIEITLRHGCSPVNLQHIFKTPFYKFIYGGLLNCQSKLHFNVKQENTQYFNNRCEFKRFQCNHGEKENMFLGNRNLNCKMSHKNFEHKQILIM